MSFLVAVQAGSPLVVHSSSGTWFLPLALSHPVLSEVLPSLPSPPGWALRPGPSLYFCLRQCLVCSGSVTSLLYLHTSAFSGPMLQSCVAERGCTKTQNCADCFSNVRITKLRWTLNASWSSYYFPCFLHFLTFPSQTSNTSFLLFILS